MSHPAAARNDTVSPLRASAARSACTVLWRRFCVGILFVVLTPFPIFAATSREYQVKAVFLFNFTPFVIWPAELCADAQAPIVIGILGDDPYGSYLDETVRDEKVGGRPLVVARYRNVDEVSACQVLFIGIAEPRRMEDVIARLKGRRILTVSDADTASRAGGVIRFVTQNNHVRLQVDVPAAKAAGLTISSKLLRAADVIGTEGD